MARGHNHGHRRLHQEEDHLHLWEVPGRSKSEKSRRLPVSDAQASIPVADAIPSARYEMKECVFTPEGVVGRRRRSSSGLQSADMDPGPAGHHVYDLHL